MTRVAMVRPDEVEWRIAVMWCDGRDVGGVKRREEKRRGPYQRKKL